MGREYSSREPISSANIFSRSVLLMDDLEGKFGWVKSGSSFAGTVDASATYVRHGAKCGLVQTRSDEPAEDEWSQGTRMVGFPRTGVLCVRAHVLFPGITTVKTMQFGATIQNATKQWTIAMRYVHADNQMGIYYANAGYGEPGTWLWTPESLCWYQIEMVADLTNDRYVRANWGGFDGGVAEEKVDVGAGSFSPLVAVYFKVVAAGANAAAVMFDDVYVGGEID